MISKINPTLGLEQVQTNLSNFSSEINLRDSFKDFSADSLLNLEFKNKRGRPRILNFTEVLKCLELKKKYACENYKGLHRCLLDQEGIGKINFKLPHYSNFLISIKATIKFLLNLIYYTTYLNKEEFQRKRIRVALVDSTPLPVCKVIRSSRHKTMKEFAQYSKSTTGWFYGFKLHVTCDYQTKRVIDFKLTNAKLDDRQYLKEIMENEKKFLNSNTMFVADKGYLASWLEALAKETGNYLLTGKKKSKNMKILASKFDIYLLHIRARIESIFSNLKLNYFLTSTRSRSVLGYLFNYVLSLYFLVNKPN